MSRQQLMAMILAFGICGSILAAGLVSLWKPSSAAQPSMTVPTPLVIEKQVAPQIVPQRLHVTYKGQDGTTVIGSGCPGNDRRGELVDYHFVVNGVNPALNVTRIIVGGDNSTITWEWPCAHVWGLHAEERDGGRWDIYVAPSEAASMYTVLVFYDNETMAMGMVNVDG